ncbi:MAG: DUF99 family protein [Candidatus Woesearchaeota archaeon]
MKKQIRIAGIDDAAFDKFSDKKAKVIGAFFRGGDFIDGVISSEIDVDGTDSTRKISEMILKSRFRPQLQAIILDGIAVGGFNVVDINSLNRKTGIPVIVVIRRMPDLKRIHSTLEKLGMEKKTRLLEKAGKPVKIGRIYVQYAGIEEGEVKEIIGITCTHSYIPEPVRVAHLIGQGISMGESRGNA